MTIHRLIQNLAFDQDDIERLAAAYEEALRAQRGFASAQGDPPAWPIPLPRTAQCYPRSIVHMLRNRSVNRLAPFLYETAVAGFNLTWN